MKEKIVKKKCLQPVEAGHANSGDNGKENLELNKRQDVPEKSSAEQKPRCTRKKRCT